MTNTDKGESVSDTECPLPKRSQLRAARPHDADDQQENPTTSAIPMSDEASAPTPDRSGSPLVSGIGSSPGVGLLVTLMGSA